MTLPARRMRLAEITPQTVEEIRSFRLEPLPSGNNKDFNFISGQFVQVIPAPGETSYFAIASAPEDHGSLEFLIKRGKGASEILFDLKVGNEVEVIGPQGKGFPIDEHKGKNLLLVGVGTGIAPLRSTLRSAIRRRNNFGDITFVYGVLTPQHFCYANELTQWGQDHVQVHLTVTYPEGTSWTGHTGFVQDILKKIRPKPENTVALLVGMKEMVQENTQLLLEMGFPNEDILLNY